MNCSRWFQMGSDGFRWFQVVSGGFRWFQVVSGGFRWFQMGSDGFRWFHNVHTDELLEFWSPDIGISEVVYQIIQFSSNLFNTEKQFPEFLVF
jgi:hypothetical protein